MRVPDLWETKVIVEGSYHNLRESPVLSLFHGASIGYDLLPGHSNGDDTYGGGSVAGCGLGGDYDLVGYNIANLGVLNSGNVQYATGYLRNSRSDAISKSTFTGAAGRHSNSGANYVMADGHAKFFRGSSVSGGYPNDQASTQPCGDNGTGSLRAATVNCTDSTIAATFNIE